MLWRLFIQWLVRATDQKADCCTCQGNAKKMTHQNLTRIPTMLAMALSMAPSLPPWNVS